MTTAITTLKEWQDRYLDLMGRVEEPIVEFTGRMAESVAEYVPERPDWELLDKVPTMTELVENGLKFRRRVVDHQAAFVRKVMKAAHPALVKLEKAPAKPAKMARTTKTAPKVRPVRAA